MDCFTRDLLEGFDMVEKSGTRITFIFVPSAPIKQAWLVGNFNDWKVGADKMKPMADGSFRMNKKLSMGRFEYKFYADEIYWNDPDAEAQAVNPFGSLNSVIEINP